MTFSAFGRKLLLVHGLIIVLCLIVLAFSIRINIFTEWFFQADLFPFGLSLATISILSFFIGLEFLVRNPITGRAQFEIVTLAFLSLFWLGFNAFTTSRYRQVPYQCRTVIPSDHPEFQVWCINTNIVKAFIWMVWVTITLLLSHVIHFVRGELSNGNKHILKVSLSKYDPQGYIDRKSDYPFAPGLSNMISNPRPLTGHSDFLQYFDSPPAPGPSHYGPPSPMNPTPVTGLQPELGKSQSTSFLQAEYYTQSSGYSSARPHYLRSSQISTSNVYPIAY